MQVLVCIKAWVQFAAAIAAALALCACSAVQDYAPDVNLDKDTCSRVFERVLMGQPRGKSPDYVACTDAYVESGSGSPGGGLVVGGLGFSRGSSCEVDRVYFASIDEIVLYEKRTWWIVDVLSRHDRRLGRYYSEDREMAERLADAFASMQARAPEPFAK